MSALQFRTKNKAYYWSNWETKHLEHQTASSPINNKAMQGLGREPALYFAQRNPVMTHNNIKSLGYVYLFIRHGTLQIEAR